MQNASGEKGKRLAPEFSLLTERERCASESGATSSPISDHRRPQTLLYLPSLNHGTIACLVAIFLCLVDLRGARLIRGREQKNISSWWTPYYLLLISVSILVSVGY